MNAGNPAGGGLGMTSGRLPHQPFRQTTTLTLPLMNIAFQLTQPERLVVKCNSNSLTSGVGAAAHVVAITLDELTVFSGM